ncbi:MAG: GNAT family N-acetyltransferase [Lachnospiraceae bacterium]
MTITKATLSDIDAIIALIQARINWMETQHLNQWNKTKYLECYPYDYFADKIREESVFVAVQDGIIIGAMALFCYDPRWENDKEAFYVHHLVADCDYPGLGRQLLSFAEEYAKEHGIKVLRLDSQQGNPVLNRYYDVLGYTKVGQCVDELYRGIKREKIL